MHDLFYRQCCVRLGNGAGAHNAEWQAMVELRTGSKPTFRYFDLLMLLDNEKGTVTEWPEPDRPVPVAAE